jgi:hypothetical protein
MRDVNARMRPRGVEDLDPEDPSQVLNDVGEPPEETAKPGKESRETGDLYGVRTPHAADADLADREGDDFEGAEEGENFLESLARHATEGGPSPDEEVVVVDESEGHHPSESGNRPVADKGSGGPGGK